VGFAIQTRSARWVSDSTHVPRLGLRPNLLLDFAESDTQRTLLTVSVIVLAVLTSTASGTSNVRGLGRQGVLHGEVKEEAAESRRGSRAVQGTLSPQATPQKLQRQIRHHGGKAQKQRDVACRNKLPRNRIFGNAPRCRFRRCAHL
jgi:hypothetical protein